MLTLIVTIILICVIGFSYAKFMPMAVAGNNNINTIIGSTSNGSGLESTFTITYDNGNQVTDSLQIDYNYENIKKFKVSTTNTFSQNIVIKLRTIVNNSASVTYNLYSCSVGAYNDVTLANVSNTCTSVKSGTLRQGNTIEKLHPTNYLTLGANGTNYYVLYLNTVSYSVNYYGHISVSSYVENSLINAIEDVYTAVSDATTSTYVTSASGVNTYYASSPTNGQGLYLNVKSNGDGVTRYFRGGDYCTYLNYDTETAAGAKCIAAGGTWSNYHCSLDDSIEQCATAGGTYYQLKNNIMFGGYAWKIIRINANGTFRVIYNGTSSTARGTDTVIAGTYAINPGALMVANDMTLAQDYASYANTNVSSLAYNINAWYSNLSIVSNYITDENFCSDTTLGTTTDSETNPITYFVPYENFRTKPTFSCPTAGTYSLTNGKLTNPIATLTVDEAALAGIGYWNSDRPYTSYIQTGIYYWTMSPGLIYRDDGYVTNCSVSGDGTISWTAVSNALSARPVINLKSDVTITGGDGTKEDPWIIDTN